MRQKSFSFSIQKFFLKEKFYGRFTGKTGEFAESFHVGAGDFGFSKVFLYKWKDNCSHTICQDRPVDILRVDLQIKWKFDNSFHKMKMLSWLTAFVLKDSSGELNNSRAAQIIHLGFGLNCNKTFEC